MNARPPMVIRTVRVPLPLWEEAQRIADVRQEAVSDVLRDALERYVKKHRTRS